MMGEAFPIQRTVLLDRFILCTFICLIWSFLVYGFVFVFRLNSGQPAYRHHLT